jgi:hypothetical protein
VSKSGGSFFCKCGSEVGKRNNKRKYNGDTNCNYFNRDMPLWTNRVSASKYIPSWAQQYPAAPRSCAARAETMRARGLDFEGNEHYLPIGLCKEFRNILLVRDPVSRIFSHVREVGKKHNESGRWVRDLRKMNVGELYDEFLPSAKGYILTDNFYVRSLAGEKVFNLPFGDVRREHLEEAKRVLASFDDVLVMFEADQGGFAYEDAGYAAAARRGVSLTAQVQRRLGWNCSTTHSPRDSRKRVRIAEREDAPWKYAEELRRRNRLDYELFAMALTIFQEEFLG